MTHHRNEEIIAGTRALRGNQVLYGLYVVGHQRGYLEAGHPCTYARSPTERARFKWPVALTDRCLLDLASV